MRRTAEIKVAPLCRVPNGMDRSSSVLGAFGCRSFLTTSLPSTKANGILEIAHERTYHRRKDYPAEAHWLSRLGANPRVRRWQHLHRRFRAGLLRSDRSAFGALLAFLL